MATESENYSYMALIAKSPQACEFCDQVFNDRFSSIVHNSSHIIIPLLKHKLHHCEICYFYFTSTDNLNTHMTKKHPQVINNSDTKNDDNVPEIKLQKVPLLNRDNNTLKVNEEIFEEDEYDSSSEDSSSDKVQRNTERNDIRNEFENEEEYTDFIRSKLRLEVEHERGGLLKDFTSDCEVNIQYTWCNNKDKDSESYNENNKSITNGLLYEEPVDEFEFDNVLRPEDPMTSDDEYESVHHADLMSFGAFSCKFCSASFTNRFSLIVHETTHMRIKKSRNRYLLCPQCDRYIAGNYRTVQRHEVAVHGTVRPNKEELQTCNICGLRYRKYSRHVRNYHPKEYESLESSKMVKDFVEPVQKSDRIEKSSIIKVCDLCYSFFRSSIKKIYMLIGTDSDPTERQCDKCKKLFCNLKTVKTVSRIRKTCQMNRGSDRKQFTNEKRLKNIQIRMKMINKLSKFYDVFLFIS